MHLSKKTLFTLAILAAVTLMVSSTVVAQKKDKERHFDPNTITTLDIEITQINGLADDSDRGNKTGKGMHYVVSSGSTSYYAIFAPAFWLDENGIELEVGTSLSVTGSVVESWHEDFSDYDVIIVTELTLDGNTVTLRDAETGDPEWPRKRHYKAPRWDPDSVDTVGGTVTDVKTRTGGKNNDTGLQITFVTGDETEYKGFVGPTFYLEEIGLSIAVDDDVTVTGSIVGKNDKNKVLIQKIIVNGTEYTLRDDEGKPLWIVE